jgi:outer membrane receptor protein involved in Fe transport
MGFDMRVSFGRGFLVGSTALALVTVNDPAQSQTNLPEIKVNEPKPTAKRATVSKRTTVRRTTARRVARTTTPTQTPPSTAATQLATTMTTLNDARSNIFAPIGNVPHDIGHDLIEALPQGANAPVDKVMLQFPGVHQDSAASGLLHVRNEHANVSYRINGILLPDGISGFGNFLESNFIGNMALLTGALPAQFGLRTAGVIDITSKSGKDLEGGSVNIYGGSRETLTPWFEYGGTAGGKTEYYFSGRFLTTNEGIENATPSLNPIHDFSTQLKGFGYVSTVLDEWTRVTMLTGAQTLRYQIPNNPGQPVGLNGVTSAFGITNFDSSVLNERQYETNFYQVLAWQKSFDGFDTQLSYFNRNSTLHYVPDPIGDLLLNGIASDVYRSTFTSGVQGDGAYKVDPAHTVRTGFRVSGEYTQVNNNSLVEPAGVDAPFTVTDTNDKLGWLLGVYIADEWKITRQLTLNLGLRFDQMYSYVDANQLSPRVNLVYKPLDWTTFHIGYARYFTPPVQSTAAPVNVALFNGTSGQAFCTTPGPGCTDPVKPERSHYFDAGVVQTLLPGLEVGVDAYYKLATDLLDDGQFGQAYVLTAFNYAKAYNYGVELSGKYKSGPFQAYANWAWGVQKGTHIDSQEYLFDPTKLAYAASNYIFTDHSQTYTASAGVAYRFWEGTRVSADLIYGSGLRADLTVPNGTPTPTVIVPNGDHVPPYAQVNLGLAHEFDPGSAWKPLTVRFDVVNVADTIYQIRNGTGVGVFAPQYGPRRGYFIGLSQKL